MKRMRGENLFSMDPIPLHGRRGRGPMRQFSIASVVFAPLGVIVSIGSIVLALWELGLLPAPPQDMVPASLALWGAATLFVFGIGLVLLFETDLRSLLQRRRSANPRTPWLADFHWNPWGSRSSSWSELLTGLYLLVFLGVLIPLLIEVAALRPEVYLGVAVAGLGALVISVKFLKELFRHVKYGSTWVRYQRFPFHPGEQVVLAWGAQHGFSPFNRVLFTLRYVVEEARIARHGGNPTVYYPYQMWAATSAIEDHGQFTPGQEHICAFSLPPDAPSTNLRNDPPRYWEFEVEIDAPGVNFQRTYPVPIYDRPRA